MDDQSVRKTVMACNARVVAQNVGCIINIPRT